MNVFRLPFLTALLLAFAAFSATANETLKIDPSQSKIEFKVRHLLGTAKGKFTKFNGTIEMNAQRVEDSSVSVVIQVASIDTAIAKRVEHLRGDDFFNVRKFPEIIFKSRQVKKTGPNAGEVIGDFTMHGVTHSILLRVQLVVPGDSAAKDRVTRWRVTTAPIKRSEFGLVWSKSVESISMIGDEVNIDIEIVAVRGT
jgi:polyisoprenoid-binding protein YceI